MHLVKQDIERERKSKEGLENLSKAMKQTPNFGNEDSQQNLSERLYHVRNFKIICVLKKIVTIQSLIQFNIIN